MPNRWGADPFIDHMPGTAGFLTSWPSVIVRPLVLSLNAVTGTVTSNAAIVSAGSRSSLTYLLQRHRSNNRYQSYFVPTGQSGAPSIYSLTSCRQLPLIGFSPACGIAPFSDTLNVATSSTTLRNPSSAQRISSTEPRSAKHPRIRDPLAPRLQSNPPPHHSTLWAEPEPTIWRLSQRATALTARSQPIPSIWFSVFSVNLRLNSSEIYCSIGSPTFQIARSMPRSGCFQCTTGRVRRNSS